MIYETVHYYTTQLPDKRFETAWEAQIAELAEHIRNETYSSTPNFNKISEYAEEIIRIRETKGVNVVYKTSPNYKVSKKEE